MELSENVEALRSAMENYIDDRYLKEKIKCTFGTEYVVLEIFELDTKEGGWSSIIRYVEFL